MNDTIEQRHEAMARFTNVQLGVITRRLYVLGLEFRAEDWTNQFDLPGGWVAGWCGPIYIGVSPEGDVHS